MFSLPYLLTCINQSSIIPHFAARIVPLFGGGALCLAELGARVAPPPEQHYIT